MHTSLATTLIALVNDHQAELFMLGSLAVAKLMAEHKRVDENVKGEVVFTTIIDAHELVLCFDTGSPARLKLVNGFALN